MEKHEFDVQALLPEVIRIAKEASHALLSYYKKLDSAQIAKKHDQTPVTQADLAAHAIIDNGLKQLTPHYPILSEEGEEVSFDIRQTWTRYWLVDPLDGTRGFIRHCDEFTVNIALIEDHRAVLGVIVQPVGNHIYYASSQGAFYIHNEEKHRPLKSMIPAKMPLRVLCGRFDRLAHEVDESFFSASKIELIKMNSSIKFPMIASGQGDLYIRVGETSEWDTAAGQCILEAAGGAVVDFEGKPLQYNAKSSLINPSFIAIGDLSQFNQCREWIQQCTRKVR